MVGQAGPLRIGSRTVSHSLRIGSRTVSHSLRIGSRTPLAREHDPGPSHAN
jgi:hypothetical protein